MVSRRQGTFVEMCANPYLFIFLNTFKYVSAHETITLINVGLRAERRGDQHFQTKLGITKYSIVTNSNDSAKDCAS